MRTWRDDPYWIGFKHGLEDRKECTCRCVTTAHYHRMVSCVLGEPFERGHRDGWFSENAATVNVWVDDLFPPNQKFLLYPVDIPRNKHPWYWFKSVEEFQKGMETLYFSVAVLALDSDLGLDRMEGRRFLRGLSTGEIAYPHLHSGTKIIPITNSPVSCLDMQKSVQLWEKSNFNPWEPV